MSRLIGRVWANGKEFRVRQVQHAQLGGEYKITDKEKRAEYEAEKAKAKKNNK